MIQSLALFWLSTLLYFCSLHFNHFYTHFLPVMSPPKIWTANFFDPLILPTSPLKPIIFKVMYSYINLALHFYSSLALILWPSNKITPLKSPGKLSTFDLHWINSKIIFPSPGPVQFNIAQDDWFVFLKIFNSTTETWFIYTIQSIHLSIQFNSSSIFT